MPEAVLHLSYCLHRHTSLFRNVRNVKPNQRLFDASHGCVQPLLLVCFWRNSFSNIVDFTLKPIWDNKRHHVRVKPKPLTENLAVAKSLMNPPFMRQASVNNPEQDHPAPKLARNADKPFLWVVAFPDLHYAVM